jgi:putative hemolysin
LYASDKCILIFPAGLVSRKQHGVIKDLTWNKSFVTMARKHKRKVIPVHIEGSNTGRFYNLANWRKRLGIKANIEMMLLPDEMYRQYHKTIRITIGKPIEWQQFGQGVSDQEWARRIYGQVYELPLLKKVW